MSLRSVVPPAPRRQASAPARAGLAAVAAAMLATIAACGDDEAAVVGLNGTGQVTVEVTVRLDPPREPFKVDGRLEARYDLAPPFAGETPVGLIVLPAGEASVTAPLRLPGQEGRISLREITFSPGAPFLCGSSDPLDPRVRRVVEIGVRLCIP